MALSWMDGKGGTIVRWQGGRGWRAVTWQVGKGGGRVVRMWQGENCARAVRAKVGKVEEWWSGKVEGPWFYSKLGTLGESQISSFCFWCWSATERRSRIALRLSGVVRGMEVLFLDLTQAVKSREGRRHLEYIVSGWFKMKFGWLGNVNLDQEMKNIASDDHWILLVVAGLVLTRVEHEETSY